MKRLFLLFATVLTAASCSQSDPGSRAEQIARQMQNPKSDYVVVAVHRGDWRNYPENSIPAIESIIRMGADIMELDLKLTKDSVLVLSHDKTLNRCTTGKGNVSDYTYAEISQMRLKRAHGVATDSLHMPTLREALECCKDRICVNVDQGYEFYDMVLAITEELGVTNQILIKGKRPVAEVAGKMAAHDNNMMYMPIIDIQKEKGRSLFNEYKESGVVPMAYELCWDKMTPEVMESISDILSQGSKLWVNTIWGSLCGYLDDDAALASGDVALIYDQVLDLGASMIQTDRPEQLIKYLEKKRRHTL